MLSASIYDISEWGSLICMLSILNMYLILLFIFPFFFCMYVLSNRLNILSKLRVMKWLDIVLVRGVVSCLLKQCFSDTRILSEWPVCCCRIMKRVIWNLMVPGWGETTPAGEVLCCVSGVGVEEFKLTTRSEACYLYLHSNITGQVYLNI